MTSIPAMHNNEPSEQKIKSHEKSHEFKSWLIGSKHNLSKSLFWTYKDRKTGEPAFLTKGQGQNLEQP